MRAATIVVNIVMLPYGIVRSVDDRVVKPRRGKRFVAYEFVRRYAVLRRMVRRARR